MHFPYYDSGDAKKAYDHYSTDNHSIPIQKMAET